MNVKNVLKLMETFDQSSLKYFEHKDQAGELILSKELPQKSQQIEKSEYPEKNSLKVEESVNLSGQKEEKSTEGQVLSPMVGVVYLQAEPDASPYVQVGDRVEKGQVICIIEAMKIMNEIVAPHGGVVEEVLIKNEDVVDYHQALMVIR